MAKRAGAKLTERVVKTARAPATGRTHVWDSDLPGFGLRVYASGRKSFVFRYTSRGRAGARRLMVLGEWGTLTLAQARRLAEKTRAAVLDGRDPLARRQRERVVIPTVAVLMERWLADHVKIHRKSWRTEEWRVRRGIIPSLGKLRVEELAPHVLANWHRKLGERTPTEANRSFAALRGAWRWAEREGLLPDGLADPTRRVKPFRERSRDRWLREEEVERLMDAVREEEDLYVRAAVPLLLLSGLRKSELLGARWEDVDLKRREIRLPETKTGTAQVRTLTEPAVEILRALPRAYASPWVFPSPVEPGAPRRDIKGQWERIRKAADLPGVTLHDLRRTCGSYLAQAGVPLQVIGEALGHTHPGVTRVYARLSRDNERDAMEALARKMAPLLGLDGGPEPDGPEGSEEARSRLRVVP